MKWDHRPYNSLDFELKKIFGKKIIKLSVDGGFTCPNRNASTGKNGCIFCSELGSGEFAGLNSESGTRILGAGISEQAEYQIGLLSKKWDGSKRENGYIIYFQSYTSTFAPVEYLRKVYEEALSVEGCVGIAIATRPDSISDEALDYLDELSKRTFLWVELGLQTASDETAKLIRRGYPLSVFSDTFERLSKRGIRVVAHLIAGLPGETGDDFMNTISYIDRIKPWGIKLHMLNVLKNTDLESMYRSGMFDTMQMDEYISLTCDALERLDPQIVVHRLTGDGDRSLLIAPKWIADKRRVLNGISKEMANRGSYQGCKL